MKSFTIFAILPLLFVFTSCQKNDDEINPTKEDCIETFSSIKGLRVADADDDTCMSYAVFKYKDNIRFVYTCCVCDLLPSVLDCEGNVVIKYEDPELQQFFEEATFMQINLIN